MHLVDELSAELDAYRASYMAAFKPSAAQERIGILAAVGFDDAGRCIVIEYDGRIYWRAAIGLCLRRQMPHRTLLEAAVDAFAWADLHVNNPQHTMTHGHTP